MLLQCSVLVLLFGLCIDAEAPCQTSTTKCCFKPKPVPEYNCHGAVIKVTPGDVQLNCKDEEEQKIKRTYWDTSNLPLLDIGNVTFFGLRNCPFPTNIKKILDDLKINTVEVLTVDYTENFGNITLTADHFQGLSGLIELHLKNNKIKYIEKNTFGKLKDVIYISLKLNNLRLLTDYTFQHADKLRRLDLSDNKIENLSENVLQNLTNLVYFSIRKNKLDDINNQTFRNLKNLLVLDLSYNYITKISESSFSNLKKLKTLILKENKLKSLPKDIFKENLNLVSVNIKSNELLTALPDYLFTNLTNLKEVYLEDCKLTVLPENVFNGCGNLEKIHLMQNNLKSLPENIFGDLINLQTLDLSFNGLRELPETLFQSLTKLNVLDLSNNSLEKLKITVFNRLFSLEEIHLNNNFLTKLHGKLFLKSDFLRIIILSNNHIVIPTYNVPFPFNILGNLEKLDLSNNSINWFSRDWILTRNKLKELDLSHNQIMSLNFEDIFAESLRLKLDLSSNNISTVNFSTAEKLVINQRKPILKYDIVMHLDNNPMNCNCHLYDLIRYFDRSMHNLVISHVKIQADNLYCTSPNNLIGFPVKKMKPHMVKCNFNELKVKPCSDICDCGFRPWDRTLLINCENRKLTRVPKLTLPTINIYNQTHVNLINNLLISGPIQGMGYENVTKMMLSFNNISELTWIPPKLEILSLDNNNIDQINNDMLTMLNSSRLTNISLGGNPYTCDCSTVNLYKSLVSLFWNKIVDVNDIKCKNGANSLVHLRTNELCPRSQVAMYVSYAILAILILIIFVFLILFYFYKIEIIMRLNKYTPSWFPKIKYDAFICYSHKDEDFVIKEIISVLEEGPNPYKLCVHMRDWTPGKFIFEQIITSVENSRRTLIILSPNFLESIWGLVEFKTAHSQAMMEGRAKVIVILYGDISKNADLDDVLKTYIRTNTYVKWGDIHFWKKLRRALDDSKSNIEMNPSQKDKNIAMTLKNNLELVNTSTNKSNTGITPPLLRQI